MVVEKDVKRVVGDTALFCDPRLPSTELIPDKIPLEHDIPYINGVVNLSATPKRRFRMIALPLKVSGVSGAPVKVVALED